MAKIDELLAQMSGRSQFCRDRGEIKTPEMLDEAAATIRALREALGPFGTEFAKTFVDSEGWTGPMNKERIVDWFGPSDFRNAAAALDASHGRVG